MNEEGRGWVWGVVAALVVLHFLLHVGFSIGRAAPDLVTVALLIGAREVGLGWAGVLGLFLGLLEDSLVALSFGANVVAMTLVGVGGAFTRDLFVGDSRLFVVSYFWLGKWVRDALHWAAMGEGFRQPFLDQVLIQGAVGGAYAALIGWLVVGVTGLAKEPA